MYLNTSTTIPEGTMESADDFFFNEFHRCCLQWTSIGGCSAKETVSVNEVQYRSTYFYAVDRKIDSCIERQKLYTLGTKTYQKNLHTDIKRSKCKHNLEGKKTKLRQKLSKAFFARLCAHIQGRIQLMRGPRLIHLWGPLSHCYKEKNGMC